MGGFRAGTFSFVLVVGARLVSAAFGGVGGASGAGWSVTAPSARGPAGAAMVALAEDPAAPHEDGPETLIAVGRVDERVSDHEFVAPLGVRRLARFRIVD